jgi:cob(I)alamin adenosyltransferase
VVIQPNFIPPGGTPASADIDIARTVCRRAERTLVRFMNANPERYDLKNLSILLNRMSDYLFILARFEEQQ